MTTAHDIYLADPELFERIAETVPMTDDEVENFDFEQAAHAEQVAERRWEER